MTGGRACLGLFLLAAWFDTAGAQSLEGVLMPGPLIRGHAKLEGDCANCHVKFDKAAQDRLCLDCHKPVARDVQEKRGHHGRIRIETCRGCHTDHKGRDANIAPVDEKGFDHAKTDFALAGAHGKVACKSCHLPVVKFRAAPPDCNGCHRKDDKHRGVLGPLCADCHGQTNWKDARFDHAKTRFPLLLKHASVACGDCHVNNVYKNTPLTCIGCHRKDDRHKGHLGEKCETCHNAGEWRDVAAFNHDRDTKYALRGKHRTAKCESCHTGASLRDKPPLTCIGCHRADDKHNGTLGTQCADCHIERGWREAKFDHDASSFPLRGKHHDVECKDCHKDPRSYKGTPDECIVCHKKDDKHETRYGDRCATCHTALSWKAKDVIFRHERDTKYALARKHAAVKCDSCHTGNLYRDQLVMDCIACHRKDDKHLGQLGSLCRDCHSEAGWKVERFDHNRTRFALTGRHARIECQACHKTLEFRNAPRDCYGCHEADDKHRRTLGRNCAVCHSTRDWRAWDFDHNRKTRFALDGAHVKIACAACHQLPADEPLRLGTACIDCHRHDDKHDGAYGRVCERCHVMRSFRELRTMSGRGSGEPGEGRSR
jgi:hypothetical protein